MKRLIPCLVLALGAGCTSGQGTMDATIVLKCYTDTTIEVDGESLSTRLIYNEFEFAFSSEDADSRVYGLLNTDAEVQVTAIYNCVGDCTLACGLPPDAEEGDIAPEIIDLNRIVVSGVIGRQEELNVAEEDLILYSPASYLSPIGPKVSDGGSVRCMTEEEYVDNLNTIYRVGAGNSSAFELEAFSVAQVNDVRTGLYDYTEGSVGLPLTYADGVGPSTMDEGCYFMPWAQFTLDRTSDVNKGDDLSGTMQVYNHDLPLLGVLVDLYAQGSPGTPANFEISGLPRDDVDIETVVTENNEPGEIGL